MFGGRRTVQMKVYVVTFASQEQDRISHIHFVAKKRWNLDRDFTAGFYRPFINLVFFNPALAFRILVSAFSINIVITHSCTHNDDKFRTHLNHRKPHTFTYLIFVIFDNRGT